MWACSEALSYWQLAKKAERVDLVCGFLVLPDFMEVQSDLMSRRGPDGSSSCCEFGYRMRHWLLNVNDCAVLQPVTHPNGNLVWNGQIYGLVAGHGRESLPIPTGTDDTLFLSNLLLSEELSLESFAAALETLDGEFAITVVSETAVFLGTDAFGTKPLSFAILPDQSIAVASYDEDLRALGLQPQRLGPGRAARFAGGNLVQMAHSNFEFEPRYSTLDEGMDAFALNLFSAVRSRARTAGNVPLIKLSSGVDSGAIAAIVASEGLPAKFWTAPVGEESEVLEQRGTILRASNYSLEQTVLTDVEYADESEHVRQAFPKYRVNAEGMAPNYPDDRLWKIPGFVVGSSILRQARALGHISELSGQGADEVLTDYLGGSGRMASTSGSPSDFRREWRNFRHGWMQAFLSANERIAGLHGFETRYPFLAKAFVQAFLDLPIEERMSPEKAPLKLVLDGLGFPFASKKVGFLGHRPSLSVLPE